MKELDTYIYLQLISVFIFLLCLCYLVFFARKNLPKVNEIFKLLEDGGYLNKEDYHFHEKLGVWGFGFRISIINMLLKGKTVKVRKGHYLKEDARQFIIKGFNDDFLWIGSYFKVLWLCGIAFIMMLLMTFILRSHGL